MEFFNDRRAEETLRVQTAVLSEQAQLLDLAHDAILVVGLDNRLTFWNQGAAEQYGWSREEALGQTIRDLLQTQFPQPLDAIQAQLFRDGRWEGELVHTRRDGSKVVMASRWVLQRNEQGSPKAVLEINNDVTERKRAEEALKKSREELERRVTERTAELLRANALLAEADRRKDVFLAMLAHELRNPLAPMLTGLHVLHQVKDPALLERTREMIERQVRHLARLVNDLLDVSRITRGMVELRLEKVDLATVVNHAVEAVRPYLDSRRHQLHVALPERPVTLRADPLRLEQILTNLLNNAAKFTDAGGRIELTAEVGVREEGVRGQGSGVSKALAPAPCPLSPELVLRVRDTGRGIAPDLLPNVFDLFTQADCALDRKEGGLGIGLTLVRSLVELHGGRVTAASGGPGQGSEFVVYLPLPAAGLAGPAAAPPAPATSGGLAPRRVLVVDDNEDAAQGLAVLLKLLGQNVRVAHDGPSALAAAVAEPPQVVLLDLGMPGMDGYEVARRLRQLPGGRNLVLVALTGWGQPEDRRRCRDAGFDRHLVKPVEPELLKQVLAQAGPQASPPTAVGGL